MRASSARPCVALICLLGLLVSSCADDNGAQPEQDEGYPAATSLDQLLDNFLIAYREMNYEEYTKLLDDSFEFFFDPDDVGEWTGYRDRWLRADDLISTGNMFGGQPDRERRVVQNIRVDFVREEPEDSDQGEGWMKVVLSQFALEVETIDQDDGQTWFLRTPGGYEVHIYAKLIDEDPAVWKIMRMVDEPPEIGAAERRIEASTFGRLKGLFHTPAGWPEAATISQLMINLERSYEEMNYDEYAEILHESYEFVFDPRDVGERTGYRDSWPKEDDLTSTQNLFSGGPDDENRVAQEIRIGFSAGEPVDSDQGEGWKKIPWTTFTLDVETIDQDDGQTWFLRTPGGYEVDVYAVLVEGSPPVWKITRIEDKPPTVSRSEPATKESTWGSIKAHFHPSPGYAAATSSLPDRDP